MTPDQFMAVDERCDLTELLKRECAHCKPPAAELDEDDEYGPMFAAQFDGWCVPCGGNILRGDEIRRGPEGYVHADCGGQ